MQKPVIDLDEVYNELSRRSLLHFTIKTMGKDSEGKDLFEPTLFHENYYSILTLWAFRKIKNLIVSVPPQHGKSEGSTRRLPAFMYGLDPNLQSAIASYSTPFARKFNKSVQKIIDSKEYNEIFPNTKISGADNKNNNYSRNADGFEIIDCRGELSAVGRAGSLTGKRVDRLYIDDLYKDYAEANSPIIRQNVIDWYEGVADSRLHNDSQQLIVFTRWHEEDLIGYLKSKNLVTMITDIEDIDPDYQGFYMINFEALKTGELTPIDQRKEGQALWESRHSADKLNRTRSRNQENFECLYQGNPESSEGYLYNGFNTYNQLPPTKKLLNYTDTADTGQDYLCSINYALGLDDNIYVTDILYTQEDMDKTRSWVVDLLRRGNINTSMIESNNGGRLFASNIKEQVSGQCVVKWFHQSNNKESRIYSNSDMVQEKIFFPADWSSRWSDFYRDVTRFKKVFKANKHDDAVDCLTGIIEQQAPNQKGRRKLILPDGRVV